MFRLKHFMNEKETELDYLCRIDETKLPTKRESAEVSKLLVNFILKHNLQLNAQKGNNYVTFREHNYKKSFIGGFGSRNQIAKIFFGEDFKLKEHMKSHMNDIISLYSKIGFKSIIREECITYSLKEGYESLEDVEYVEFVYNFNLAKSEENLFHADSKVLVRHYFENKAPSINTVDHNSMYLDLVITITTEMKKFGEIFPEFINANKNIFCKKHNLDVKDYNEDMNTLIQMLEI